MVHHRVRHFKRSLHQICTHVIRRKRNNPIAQQRSAPVSSATAHDWFLSTQSCILAYGTYYRETFSPLPRLPNRKTTKKLHNQRKGERGKNTDLPPSKKGQIIKRYDDGASRVEKHSPCILIARMGWSLRKSNRFNPGTHIHTHMMGHQGSNGKSKEGKERSKRRTCNLMEKMSPITIPFPTNPHVAVIGLQTFSAQW